jgi:hypothetical protein
MQTTHLSKIVLTSLALLGLMSAPSWAASDKSAKGKLATIQAFGNSVHWSLKSASGFGKSKLTLSPEGGDPIVIESEAGLEPSISALKDGAYKYEIVITPTLSQAVRDELKAAREAADGQEATAAVRDLINQGKIPKERKVQSGYFRILNGQKVAADAAKE